jgi:hypothetical protein
MYYKLVFIKIMRKRIFLMGGLAIAVGFAVANVGLAKQNIKMSLFLENVIAMSTPENGGAIDLGRCYMTVTLKNSQEFLFNNVLQTQVGQQFIRVMVRLWYNQLRIISQIQGSVIQRM